MENCKNGKLGPEKLENGKVGKVASCPRKSVFCRYLPVKIGKCRRMGGVAYIYIISCIWLVRQFCCWVAFVANVSVSFHS